MHCIKTYEEHCENDKENAVLPFRRQSLNISPISLHSTSFFSLNYMLHAHWGSCGWEHALWSLLAPDPALALGRHSTSLGVSISLILRKMALMTILHVIGELIE